MDFKTKPGAMGWIENNCLAGTDSDSPKLMFLGCEEALSRFVGQEEERPDWKRPRTQ